MWLLRLVSLLLLAGMIVWLQSLALPFGPVLETVYLAQPYDQKGLLKGGLYLFSYLLTVVSLLTLILVHRRWLALLLLLAGALAFSIDVFVQRLGSSSNGLNLEILSLALNEAGKAGNLLVYAEPLLDAFLIFLAILIVLLVMRSVVFREVRLHSGRVLLLALFGLLLAAGLVFRIPSIQSYAYPALFKLPIIGTEYWLRHREQQPRILPASIQPQQAAQYRTLIWIIDESVSGDYLSLNGYAKPTTPFLDAYQHQPGFYNFGVVNPVSNCSNSSNLFLRIGLTTTLAGDSQQFRLSLPTIFAYAQRARYETHLLDAQTSEGELQNHLTTDDLQYIDVHKTLSRQHIPAERDALLGAYLREQLQQDDQKRRFIVAVKWGAHWPYSLAYPPDKTVFEPTAHESLTPMVEENRAILTNAYANVLRYTVDDFFRDLSQQPLQADQLIFYTSDHGQSLFEQADSPLTHCHFAQDPQQLPQGEFRVPLFVLTPTAKQQFSPQAGRNYAQEQLFATTLQLFGYDREVYGRHGPTLYEGDVRPYAESFVLDSGLKIRFDK
ncbi:MAG: sulfatase-like hydrolase/transferase [Thiolinea sp.]